MLHSCQRYGNIALWLSDAIWRQRSGSTLDKVMACCLMVPRHYLNKWLIISKVLCYCPHGFTQQMHKVPVIDISLKLTNSKSWPHFSGDNNLMHFIRLLQTWHSFKYIPKHEADCIYDKYWILIFDQHDIWRAFLVVYQLLKFAFYLTKFCTNFTEADVIKNVHAALPCNIRN